MLFLFIFFSFSNTLISCNCTQMFCQNSNCLHVHWMWRCTSNTTAHGDIANLNNSRYTYVIDTTIIKLHVHVCVCKTIIVKKHNNLDSTIYVEVICINNFILRKCKNNTNAFINQMPF